MADLALRINEALAEARRGRLAQAAAGLRRLVEKHPDSGEASAALGYVLAIEGKAQQALHHLRRALERRPDQPGWLCNLGRLLIETGKPEEGMASLRRSLDVEPGFLEARINLMSALVDQGRFFSAAALGREGMTTAARDARLALAHATALRGLGDAEEAAATLRAALEAEPGRLTLASSLAFTMNYVASATPRERLEAHQNYGRLLHATLGPGPGPAQRHEGPLGRLRIGILSGELVTHPVAFFLEPLLRHLDRERCEVVLFHTAQREDETTARLRSLASSYKRVGDLDVRAMDAALRSERLDALIELTGHTAYHRLPSLRFRPAPVQATWLGYPSTTGVPEVDHRIVDSLTDPPGAEALATERLVRTDPCFLCYGPPPEADAPAPVVGRARDGAPVTFGSFNSLIKMNDGVVDLWSRILREAEGSRLTLKDYAFVEREAGDMVRARFEARGVAPERITTLPKTASLRDHLELYNGIDIALDTFPYNGTTTTCEALLMGTPVVTLAGDSHAGRVGVSLLTNAGMGEFIAKDGEEYARMAVSLALDATRRGELHATLRDRLLASPLCDAPAFASRFEAAVRRMCEGEGGRQ